MRHELTGRPDYGMLKIGFDAAGEQIVAEAGAMVARDVGVEMQTSLRGGLLAAAKRRVLGGESLFLNTFRATAAGQHVFLAAAAEGDVLHHDLDGQKELYIQSSCFLASGPTVVLDTKWGGARGFFSGTGLFLLKASGRGDVFVAAYGGLHEVEVGADGYVVDTGHIVAFTSGIDYRISRVGGLKSLFLSGEGLVARFSGQGKLWIQTRNPGGLAFFLHPFRRVQQNRQNLLDRVTD